MGVAYGPSREGGRGVIPNLFRTAAASCLSRVMADRTRADGRDGWVDDGRWTQRERPAVGQSRSRRILGCSVQVWFGG